MWVWGRDICLLHVCHHLPGQGEWEWVRCFVGLGDVIQCDYNKLWSLSLRLSPNLIQIHISAADPRQKQNRARFNAWCCMVCHARISLPVTHTYRLTMCHALERCTDITLRHLLIWHPSKPPTKWLLLHQWYSGLTTPCMCACVCKCASTSLQEAFNHYWSNILQNPQPTDYCCTSDTQVSLPPVFVCECV